MAHRQRGFTLTELLISLVLGIFVVGGVLSVFLGGLESFRTTDALSRIQESGRFALEIMRRDVRGAGYSGCRRTLEPDLPRVPIGLVRPLDPGFVRNTLRPAPTGGVDPLSFAEDFGAALLGYEATGDGTGSSWVAGDATMPTAASNPLISGARDDSDILVVVTTRDAGFAVAPGHSSATDPIPIADATHPFEIGDTILITDCESAAITEVTGIDASDDLEHEDAAGSPGNYSNHLGRAFAGSQAQVALIERAAYYIADSAVTGRPALFRNGEEIAENVEDLQVRYGVDTDEDRQIDGYFTAQEILADSGLLWDNALAVRVSLRISSGGEGNLTEQPVTLNYDGNTFTAEADDFRLHQVFTTTVGIRNQLP